MPLAGLKYQSVTFGKAHQKTMSSSYIYGEWEFRTRVRVEFLKQKIRKKVLEHKSKSTSTSPERGREPRRWTRRGWWNPGDWCAWSIEESERTKRSWKPWGWTGWTRWTGRWLAGGGGGGAFRLCFTSCCAQLSWLSPDEQLSGEIAFLRAELIQKVLEGLRGDAYLAAQDLGAETLMRDGGIETLIATLKKIIFPLQSLEAKELFRVGQMQHGPLSRQTGESVTSFISRRRRWWRQVKELDSDMLISDQMHAELLIKSAGLT